MAEAFASGASASGMARAVASGEVSAVGLCRRALDEAEGYGRRLGAILAVEQELALRDAEAVDAAIRAGAPPGPLAGVPVVVKDNIAVEGWPLTCGSRILEGFRSPDDSTVWRRLRAAGAVCVARGNMDEFAMGSSSESSAFGPVRNPWDPSRVPGGSSGGSAASVAAGIVPLALGSDTGGSVRQPAAFCGVYGYKPTWGRLSRAGLVAYGSSLDQVGPIARSAGDLRLVVELAAGEDGRDSTALPSPEAGFPAGGSFAGLRVGIPSEARLAELDPAVESAFSEGVERLRGAGASVVGISIPSLPVAIATYYIVATAEASSNLARFDGVRYGLRVGADDLAGLFERSRGAGFGPEVRRRILTGTFVLSAGYAEEYYGRAQQARRRLVQDFAEAFRSVDLVATPTAPSGAFRLGEKVSDPLAMYLSDIYTVPANLAGLPAVAMPCGRDRDGLPLSLQLAGPAGADPLVLAAAAAWEELSGGPAPLAPPCAPLSPVSC